MGFNSGFKGLIFTFISHRWNTVFTTDGVFQYLAAPSTAGYQNMQKEALSSTRFCGDRVPVLVNITACSSYNFKRRKNPTVYNNKIIKQIKINEIIS